jgi:hypothetical protein
VGSEHELELLRIWSECQEEIESDEARIQRFKKVQLRCQVLIGECRQIGDPSGVSRKVQRFLDQITGWD